MYNVSEEYKYASLRPSRESKVEGFIELSDGIKITFNSNDILNGSLSIDNAAVDEQELNLGTVYAGKMQATIRLSIDRYQLYNKKIGLSYFLKVNDTWEEVPLGVYYISEAQRNGKYVTITSYDSMLNFDKEFSDITNGKPSTLISKCCKKCNVEMEQTEEEIDAISPFEIVEEEGEEVNQVLQYGLPSDNSITTYRGLLSELATILGGFFVIGRNGKLKLMKFGEDSGVIINDTIRKSAEIYDYQCEYSGVKSILNGEEYIAGNSDKIVLNIGDLGLLKNGLIETKKKTVDFIYEQIKDIKYTPGSISWIGDPSIDLGDIITIDGYDADPDGTKMCITSYNWNFHGNHKIQAVGKNIKIVDSKKQTTNQIKNIAENVKQESIQKFLTFYNSEAFEIGQTPYRIARILVPVSEKTTVLATGQIILNVTTPGTVKIKYKINDEEQLFSPQQIMPIDGYYILSVLYVLKDITEETQNIFEVYIESEDGTANVDVENCIINLSGSGIVDAKKWDGTLSFNEGITAIYLGTVNMNINYVDNLKTTLHRCSKISLNENYDPVYLGSYIQNYNDAYKLNIIDNCFPTTFSEKHKKLNFSFGGINISDDIQIVVEEET